MRACRSLLAVLVIPVWLAACASAPEKPPGIFDLSNGLDQPSSATSRQQPGALAPSPRGSIGNSIGAPTPGRLGDGIGN